MIIDCHMHLWEKATGKDLIQRDYGRFESGGKMVQMMPVSFVDSSSTAEMALAHMDWLGIDRGVVVQEWMDGRQDEYLARVAKSHHDRFSLLGLFDWNDMADASAYVDRMVNELHLDGIKVTTPAASERMPLDDERLLRGWERCSSLGVPVVIHMLPGDTMVAEAERVVRALPKLKFVVCHLGLPPSKGWQKQVALGKFPNVFIDASGLTALFAHESYPFPGAQAAIKEAFDIAGPNKIMWGSDYPRTIVEVTYKEILDLFRKECPFLSNQERAGILGETAARVYRFGK